MWAYRTVQEFGDERHMSVHAPDAISPHYSICIDGRHTERLMIDCTYWIGLNENSDSSYHDFVYPR